MNAPVDASIVTVPLEVLAGAVYWSASPSASTPETVPVTTPVEESGEPVVTDSVGAVSAGRIATVTVVDVPAPSSSVAVTVKLSVLSASVAVGEAAACRAAAVGV